MRGLSNLSLVEICRNLIHQNFHTLNFCTVQYYYTGSIFICICSLQENPKGMLYGQMIHMLYFLELPVYIMGSL